eukprot:TRINITY_DN67220_c0_g1_i1.p1 TRINITY_DN67220_c0_g1~~TRINITY_DN67220_c0_g1_i1.p1  ORF type:complete len:135 (+),score=19.24 TRINITY_DN67220_c0_g1_i1:102-506(+)
MAVLQQQDSSRGFFVDVLSWVAERLTRENSDYDDDPSICYRIDTEHIVFECRRPNRADEDANHQIESNAFEVEMDGSGDRASYTLKFLSNGSRSFHYVDDGCARHLSGTTLGAVKNVEFHSLPVHPMRSLREQK